ncbi:MAG: transmembrane 220 family protein [Saprospiraceae bacterium]|nr:transmembrane 220 family protein [Saprospiraceae bacterium]
MKIANLILCLLFIAFAVIQFNDPDPEFWVTLYAGIAIISGFAAFRRYNVWIILLGLVVVAYELFKLFPSFWNWVQDGTPSITESMKAESPYIELVREFLGLVICMAVLVFHYVRARVQTLRNGSMQREA